MIRLFWFLVLVVPALAVDTCVDCHKEQSDKTLSRQVAQVANDVHGRAGLSCHQCHGGDPLVGMDDPYESMDEKKGYIGIPKPAQSVAMCAKCHSDPKFMRDHAPGLPTDQAAKFALSGHAKGATTCSSCHRAHAVLPSTDPRSSVHPLQVPSTCGTCHADPAKMGTCNLATDVVAQYTLSVHWKAAKTRPDRAAPVCHDCHGNHLATTPAPATVANVCGRCHTAERAAFATGKHAGLKAFSGCIECHSNHKVEAPSDEMLSPTGVCCRCHQTSKVQEHAKSLHALYTSFDADLAKATVALEPLKARGLDVRDAEEKLVAAKQELIAARRLVHTDDRAAIEKQLAAGRQHYDQSQALAEKARGGQRSRTVGGIAFALFALITAMTLVAKVVDLVGAGEHVPAPAPAPPEAPPRARPRRKKGKRR